MGHNLMYGMSLWKKVWTVIAKDFEWLTVKLADDSKDITGIQHELEQLGQTPTSIRAQGMNRL